MALNIFNKDSRAFEPDEHILELLARSEPQAIELLYDKYSSLAYTLAYRVLADANAAEDVVQEAFLSIWRRGSTYKADRGNLKAWICAIVHNKALDQLRGHSGRARSDVALEHAPVQSTPISDTWDKVASELEREHIVKALKNLSIEQRETIELAYFGGYSQSEISDAMDVPLGTVKGRIRLGLRKLRTNLSPVLLEVKV